MPRNDIRLKKIFSTCLDISESKVHDDLEYNTITEWDSVGHMGLVAGIEQEFDVMLDTDDILNMSSVRKSKEILIKYGVDF